MEGQADEQALLRSIADAVAILWDEAQERQPLLRFLAPFGRPDLLRLEHAFRTAPSIDWLLSEPWPLFGTWLAAAVVRLSLELPTDARAHQNELCGSTERPHGLVLGPARSLVVAGDLEAPFVIVDPGARLAVAGSVRVGTLLSNGLVLVQKELRAHTIAVAPSPAFEEAPPFSQRFTGWQVGERVSATVLDSPRFGLACPLECEGVLRLAGRSPDPTQRERGQARLEHPVWSDTIGGIDSALLRDLLVRG